MYRAGEFDGIRIVAHVDDLAAENIGEALDVRARLGIFDTDFNQQHFPFDMLAFGEVHQFHHVHQLVQLLGDLLDDRVRAVSDNRHARQGGVFGGRYGQRFDIVTTGGEQTGDTRQRARFVFE